MAKTVINIDRKNLDRELYSTAGSVGRYLKLIAHRIKRGARAQVGVDTGALRSSIHLRHRRDVRGQYYWIGSNLPYARMHHEGTKPHIITPNNGRALRFFVRGAVVFAHKVRHPGTRPNRYLTDQLKLIR